MNAGGMPNTCKSNGKIAIFSSGERERNTQELASRSEDNIGKPLLILHNAEERKVKTAERGACG
jgi:hypothetical protein